MSPVEYDVTYFDIRGRAEPIRLLLKLAGQTFRDVRVSGNWAEIKPTTPLGQLPVLTERRDGQAAQIPQSQAILRHLARTYGLYGRDPMDMVQCDLVGDTIVDARSAFTPLAFGPNRGKDPAALVKFFEQTLPVHLWRLDALAARGRGGDAGFVVNSTPTWADVVAHDFLESMLVVDPRCLERFPRLARLHAAVAALPELQEWLHTRKAHEWADLAAVLRTREPLS